MFLCDLLQDNDEVHWNIELKTLFQQIETSVTQAISLNLPNTNHPILVTPDCSLIGIGCFRFQMDNKKNIYFFLKTLLVLEQFDKISTPFIEKSSELYIC